MKCRLTCLWQSTLFGFHLHRSIFILQVTGDVCSKESFSSVTKAYSMIKHTSLIPLSCWCWSSIKDGSCQYILSDCCVSGLYLCYASQNTDSSINSMKYILRSSYGCDCSVSCCFFQLHCALLIITKCVPCHHRQSSSGYYCPMCWCDLCGSKKTVGFELNLKLLSLLLLCFLQ